MRRAPISLLLLASAALVPSGTAGAVPAKAPWATINICDTAKKRNSVGIRAGMPGNGTRQRMYMRFQLQWYRPAERRYEDTGVPSTWVSAGPARFRAAQRGFTFAGIADPPAGGRFKLRGEVSYQWRALRPVREGSRQRREVVVGRARRFTRGGLRGVAGGKPSGRSDAACVVYGPKTTS